MSNCIDASAGRMNALPETVYPTHIDSTDAKRKR